MNDRSGVIQLKATCTGVGSALSRHQFLTNTGDAFTTGMWIHRMTVVSVGGSGTSVSLLNAVEWDGATEVNLYSFRTAPMNALVMPYDTASAELENNALPVFVSLSDETYFYASIQTNNVSNTDSVNVTLWVSAA